MGNSTQGKCKICKGTGLVGINQTCHSCEGSGVILHSTIEEQFDNASELSGDKIYPDQVGYIDFEEEDYEI